MVLTMRMCIFGQGRQYLSNIAVLNSTICGARHTSTLFKRTAPTSQIAYSTDTQKQENKTIKIYNGILTSHIVRVKGFSLLTSIISLGSQPFFFDKIGSDISTAVLTGISISITLLAVATPLLLHSITRKYVTQLEYDPKDDKYIATLYTIFLRKKKLEFTPADVEMPLVERMFTSCFVKGIPIFIDPRHFDDYTHYKRIMGYDKPVDLKLHVPSIRK
ncbi:transmembrane protein 70 homolog, mitochondrial [Orussus abietinus]|uniref:transmembrane protein 70 homolog, mitochondrial n=1 Tax=Orussus abietinus TaxID=222816 RepID=UPI00062565DF|nr:transmembrane protein 70 homolog, mitochondrial [Orussus abietinus]